MKLKNFNWNIFSTVTIVFGLLLIPGLLAAYAEDEGTLRPGRTWWNFFAGLFHVLRFPTHTLLWPIIIAGGPWTFFGGLIINCGFYGLLVERITLLFRK